MLVGKQIEQCIKYERVAILDELYQFRGLLNTRAKMDEIDERLNDMVNEEEDIDKFSKKLEKLIKSSFNI